MAKPCADVPEHIWISDSFISRPAKSERRGKVDWTPALLARCQAMHEAGDNYGEIARMIQEQTGTKIARSSVQDYLAKHE